MKGTLVHAALEALFWDHPAGRRSPEAAAAELLAAWERLGTDPEYAALELAPDEAEAFLADAELLVANYFALEDPDRRARTVGIELGLEAELAGMRLRGILDRLDLDDDGELVVVDYKTGRAPSVRFERARLSGVHIYSLLCEQVLGRAPVAVRLLHLRDPVTITALPTEQSLRGQRQRTTAVWRAIERACAREDFRPPPGAAVRLLQLPGPLPRLRGEPAGGCRGLLSPAGPSPAPAPGSTTGEAPGSLFARFDEAVDARAERLRGRPRLDAAAAVVSNLADYGIVWVLLAALKGRRRGEARGRAVRALARAGFTSLALNAAVKAAVGRPRPATPGAPPAGPVPVRSPASSSFPSGHTLAAFCTAVALAESPGETAAYLALATAVAASRVHLRAHHASDVVGGALIGTAVGAIGRHRTGSR